MPAGAVVTGWMDAHGYSTTYILIHSQDMPLVSWDSTAQEEIQAVDGTFLSAKPNPSKLMPRSAAVPPG